jgi:hypothetical protein
VLLAVLVLGCLVLAVVVGLVVALVVVEAVVEQEEISPLVAAVGADASRLIR